MAGGVRYSHLDIAFGRDIHGKITGQIRYVMAGLFGVLMLIVLASLFGINNGNVLSPVLLLFVTFFIGIFPAIGISTDSSEQRIMDLPPRDPTETILKSRTLPRWFGFGLVRALVGLAPFVYPGELSVEVKQTLTFSIVSAGSHVGSRNRYPTFDALKSAVSSSSATPPSFSRSRMLIDRLRKVRVFCVAVYVGVGYLFVEFLYDIFIYFSRPPSHTPTTSERRGAIGFLPNSPHY